MSEMPTIEATEKSMKESGGITKEDIQMFANFLGCSEVLKAEAEYAKNNYVYDRYGEGSEHCDIWVTVTAFDSFGRKTFVIGCAYLSDIWEIGGVDSEELKSRMYIRTFTDRK